MVETLEFNAASMKAGADSPYLVATDLADFLVEKGVPFRTAHSTIAALVRQSLDSGDKELWTGQLFYCCLKDRSLWRDRHFLPFCFIFYGPVYTAGFKS